jgi:hypothetical protein
MKKFLLQTQKIKATCIVQYEGKVLLLRSDQVVDREHRPQAGYFGVPSFTISFGEDPQVMLQETLQEYFEQSVQDLSMIDVRQYMSKDGTVQIFEVVYTAKSLTEVELENQRDKFLFVHKSELGSYMFPTEREYLERYL